MRWVAALTLLTVVVVTTSAEAACLGLACPSRFGIEAQPRTVSPHDVYRDHLARRNQRLLEDAARGGCDFHCQMMQEHNGHHESFHVPSVPPSGAGDGLMGRLQHFFGALEGRSVRQAPQLPPPRPSDDRVVAAYKADALRFMRERPDFRHAYFYLIDARHRDLIGQGVNDRQKRDALIEHEEYIIARESFAARVSPSELLYQVAVERGYKPQ